MALLSTLRVRSLAMSSTLLRSFSSSQAMRTPVLTLAVLRAQGARTLSLPLPPRFCVAPYSSHAKESHGDGHGHGGGVELSGQAITGPTQIACMVPIVVMVLHILLVPSALVTNPNPFGAPDLLELNMADGPFPMDPLGVIVLGSVLLPMIITPMVKIPKPNVNLPFLPLRHAVIAGWANRMWFDRIFNSFVVYLHASVISRMVAHIEYGFLALYPGPRMMESWAKRPGSGWLK